MSSFHRQNFSRPFTNFLLFGFGGVLLILYLLGRVQIDFELRKNEALQKQRRILESEITLLHVQIDSLKSYSRIVMAAKAQGLEPSSSDQLAQLEVDLRGVHQKESKVFSKKIVAAGIFSLSK